MSDTYIRNAFETVCSEATPPERLYLSLYRIVSYYGGPEEGGWWGSDWELEASQQFTSQEALEAAESAVEKLAEQYSAQAQRSYGEACKDSLEWLDARGLDADYLPPPDGPDRFIVVTETRMGSHESQGPRHYE